MTQPTAPQETLGQRLVRNWMHESTRHAEDGAPASLSSLVIAVARQKQATSEQVAHLRQWLGTWAIEQGDCLDQDLLNAVCESWRCTHEWTPAEREEWDWVSRQSADYLISCGIDIGEAVAKWARSIEREADERENVAAHCGVLVAAGEHGSESRYRALCDRVVREHRSWAD